MRRPGETIDLTPQDFMSLGVQQMAYVKPIVLDGARAHAVHAADGTRIGVIEDRDAAFAAVRDRDLEPLSVH